MEYQKIISLLGNTPDQPSKFRTKNLVKINDDSLTIYNTNSQTKFKTSMLKSSLCNYSDVYILFKRTITVPNMETTTAAANNSDTKVLFKACAWFTVWFINNTN